MLGKEDILPALRLDCEKQLLQEGGAFMKAEKVKVQVAQVKSDSLQPCGLHIPWNSPGQNTGVGSLSLLQGIFPTQGSNPGLLHGKWILYQLSHREAL